MLLTMDIGNTNINIGLFDGDDLAVSVRLATERQKTDDQYAMDFTNIFVMHKVDFNEISGVIISSVVPEITEAVTSAIKKLTGKNALILSPGVKTGLNILIDNPAQLGADLAAGAVGVVANHGIEVNNTIVYLKDYIPVQTQVVLTEKKIVPLLLLGKKLLKKNPIDI